MPKLIVKYMDICGYDLDEKDISEYKSFPIEITLTIGCSYIEGTNLFYALIVKVDYDLENTKIENKTIFAKNPNSQIISDFITSLVENIEFDTWEEAVEKLRFYFRWEYDGYYVLNTIRP